MNINKAFPSEYLRASDLNNQTPTVTIDRVEAKNIGQDLRLVVYFAKQKKGLVLNKTNANTIAELTGSEDTDNWGGHRIKLITARVEYQGKRVPAIRIDPPDSPGRASTRQPIPEPEPEDITDVPDDTDIAF